MPDQQPQPRPGILASFVKSIRAVMWSFFGVRKGKDHERDLASLNPLHVVIAGFLCMAIFIAILLTVVHMVTH
jgi:Protein of unknown function (DUF2970)